MAIVFFLLFRLYWRYDNRTMLNFYHSHHMDLYDLINTLTAQSKIIFFAILSRIISLPLFNSHTLWHTTATMQILHFNNWPQYTVYCVL